MTALVSLRRLVVGVAAAAAVFAPADRAGADPAAPTDFRSEIVAVNPPTDAVEVSVVGNDAFVMLRAAAGSTVEILGYRGEPYLMFDADGTVRVNDVSPTAAANRSRYGAMPATPDNVDPRTVPPVWKVVAGDGTYAWHDHRTHWMAPAPPTDAVRGAVFSTSELDLLVNGEPVRVSFAHRWLGTSSEVPAVGGLLVGAFTVLIVLSVRRTLSIALALAALAATGIGWWQYRSFPPSSDPLVTWYLLPALAAGAGIIGIVLARSLVGKALLMFGGLLLAVWVFLRRDGFVKAALPTDAPFWLDRGVSAAAGVVAAVAIIGGAVRMFRMPAAPAPVPAPKGSKKRSAAAAAETTTWGRKR